MKQKRNFIAVLFLLLLCTVINICPAAWADSLEVYVDPPCDFWKGTFHGIWIGASKNLEDAKREAYNAPEEIGVVQIFLTTDWSNLNTEPWYVLTAGMYTNVVEAEDMLPEIQAYYPDAYIKYSGNRIGSFSGNADYSIDGTYIFEGVKLYEDNHLNTPVPNTPWEGNTVQIKRKSDKTIYLTVGEGCYNAGKTIAYEKDFDGRYLSSIDLEWLTFENGDLVLYGEEGDFVDRYAQVYKKVSETAVSNVTDNSSVYEGQVRGIFKKQDGRYIYTGDILGYEESRVGRNDDWTEGFYTVTNGTFYVDKNTKVTVNIEDFPVKGKTAVAWMDDFYARKKYWMILTVKVKGDHVEEITGIISAD